MVFVPHRSLRGTSACHRCLDAPHQKSHAQATTPASASTEFPVTHRAGEKVPAIPKHGAVLDLRTAKDQRRARERLRAMSAMQAEVPLPTPPCAAGDPASLQAWGEVVEFTFASVVTEAVNESTKPQYIASLALAYLCRYLDRAEDDPSTGGGTGGKSAGAPAGAPSRGRGRASERTLSETNWLAASSLVSIVAAFKTYGFHPPYDKRLCGLLPSARLTKARPTPAPRPAPPRRRLPPPHSSPFPCLPSRKRLRPRTRAPFHV